MRIQRFLGELCIFKHRASATENEHRAAQHIYQLMRSIGLIAKIDEFKSQKRMTWELITILAFFLMNVFVYFNQPIVAIFLGLIGLILFWGHFTTRFRPLLSLFRISKSSNVIGKILNPDAPFKIILTAHYDTARSGPMWHPKQVSSFRFNFLLGLFLIIGLIALSILKAFHFTHTIFSIFIIFVGIFIAGQMAILIYSGIKGELVQGASDNASGVAVMLDLATRLKEINFPEFEFWFVATGSEETGAIGMSEFLKSNSEEIERSNSYFINFDNIGSGNLHYYTGEGMINLYRFSTELINAAKKTTAQKKYKSVTPERYRLAYTDAIVPASRGFEAILFLATDDRGQIPNWQWKTDTLVNIDYSTLELASDYAFEMIKNLNASLKENMQKDIQNMKQFQTELGNSEEI